jgi:ketosteroid isomerase-like protein
MHNTTTITTSREHLDAVSRLYAAYGRGDVDAVLAEVADDVDWAAEAAGDAAPWYGPHRGKEGVTRFFAEIGSSIAVTEFEIVGLTAGDSDVVATIHWTFTVNATGRTASMYMQHWWRFADGRIEFFRGSEDSLQTAAAFGEV